MAIEKDFIQAMKLEISKNFTLNPYERIAFHKILSIMKSENGMNVLLRDIPRKGVIRSSAIENLKAFDNPRVTETFISLLSETKLSDKDIFNILEHIETFGSEKEASALISLISANRTIPDKVSFVAKSISVLGNIDPYGDKTSDIIRQIAENQQIETEARKSAIETTIIREISFYENLLKENNDELNSSIYKALAVIAEQEMAKYESRAENEIFTVLPDENDKVLLEIRVLLGKMTTSFDASSAQTKTAFILSMISCGHREYLIYTMKALSSNNPDLIDLTLFVILANVEKIRTPDVFLRNLISLSSVTDRDSELIIQIFEKFFETLKNNRTSNMMRNKINNFIIVMLDNFFETYRKSFMIPEIMEKDYPDNFKKIRSLVLNRFNPDIKKKILFFLNDDSYLLKNLIEEISEQIKYIPEAEKENLSALIDILWDTDQKAKSISVTRIQDIDFEKRYLKNRIIRLCEIIGRISIEDASSSLVKIFNYIKKYHDTEIFDAATIALSRLNYPYMLSELEVLLMSGDESEKMKAVDLFSLFSDQRSLNILLDYLKDNHKSNDDMALRILNIVIRRDISNNKAASQIAKAISETNANPEIRKTAVQLIGKCGFEQDVLYLNELFVETTDNSTREGIVRALDFLLKSVSSESKKSVTTLLKKCLLDSSIKVRMFACMAMLQDGSADALKTIRDMMIIRNKAVQRDILNTLESYITVELGFFFISLLREEYAISQDIIPLLRYLPYEDKKDIDHFIINIFKKHEGFGDSSIDLSKEYMKEEEYFKSAKIENLTLMFFDIINYEEILSQSSSSDSSTVAKIIFSTILDVTKENSGTVSRMTGGKIVVYFPNPLSAASAMIEINEKISFYNSKILPEYQVLFSVYLTQTDAYVISEEIILIPYHESEILLKSPFKKRLFVNENLSQILNYSFKCGIFSELAFDLKGSNFSVSELQNPLNFTMAADEMIIRLKDEEKKRKEIEQQLEEAMRIKNEPKTRNMSAYTNKMDEIGRIMKKEILEVNKYISKRSTDRELIKNTEKMLNNIYKRYMLEVSKTVME
ncbi:MAG TPA: hypothetical protein PLJ39_02835 [Spirochaetota bacterium]|nr:hypothetical protein [Spirochaetota bacterium]HPY01940.1 hypothetical protein [Spirochaetota bacterium]